MGRRGASPVGGGCEVGVAVERSRAVCGSGRSNELDASRGRRSGGSAGKRDAEASEGDDDVGCPWPRLLEPDDRLAAGAGDGGRGMPDAVTQLLSLDPPIGPRVSGGDRRVVVRCCWCAVSWWRARAGAGVVLGWAVSARSVVRCAGPRARCQPLAAGCRSRRALSAVTNWSAQGQLVGMRKVGRPERLTSRAGRARSRVRMLRVTMS